MKRTNPKFINKLLVLGAFAGLASLLGLFSGCKVRTQSNTAPSTADQDAVHYARLLPSDFVHYPDAGRPVEYGGDDRDLSARDFDELAPKVNAALAGQLRLQSDGDSAVFRPYSGSPPPPPLQFEPPFNPIVADPQVAVGGHYVVVGESHSLAFYDKSGNLLPQTTKIPVSMSSEDLFGRFLLPQIDGKPNMDNINRFAGFPQNPVCDPKTGTCIRCNPSDNSGGACIWEVFDLRVAYDPFRNRFVFAGIARNIGGGVYSQGDPRLALVRRYTMFAMTVDDDPRDGFYTWWMPETGDWPQIAVTDRYFLITYGGQNGFWDNQGNPVPAVDELVADNKYDDKGDMLHAKNKVVVIVPADDMAKGTSPLARRDYTSSQKLNWGVRPVVIHGPSPGYVFFVVPGNKSLIVWAWAPPKQGGQSQLLETEAPLAADTGMIRGSPVYVSGKIHVVFAIGSSQHPGVLLARVVRIKVDVTGIACGDKAKIAEWSQEIKEIQNSPGYIQGTKDPQPGKPDPEDFKQVKELLKKIDDEASKHCPQLTASADLDHPFGLRGPGDSPSDLISYDLPSLEVNTQGDMVIAYVRVPVKTEKLLYNETRYSIMYHNESKPENSVLVRKGDGKASWDPYAAHHSLDLAVQSLDPSDGLTVWFTHVYAMSSGAYGMVVSRVKP
jgi:hypothetical protein